MKEATVAEVKQFFGMNATEMLKEWKRLTDQERAFFKREVGKVINNDTK